MADPQRAPAGCRAIPAQEVGGHLEENAPAVGQPRDARPITESSQESVLQMKRAALISALLLAASPAAMAMSLNSPAFQPNGHIPSKYTCEGEDISPPLGWEGVPNGAKSIPDYR